MASRRPQLAEWILGAAGVIQTVPSLALLALMVPLLDGMIGFWPALLALVLYSILPILANTVVGIRGVEPALIEAARGLGMSDWQMLVRVELPLAAPVILGGVRTATVLVVGTVTLVTTVGGASLGNYIFSGLESFNDLWTIFGCVLRRAAGRDARPVGAPAGVGGPAAQSAAGLGRRGRTAAGRRRRPLLSRRAHSRLAGRAGTVGRGGPGPPRAATRSRPPGVSTCRICSRSCPSTWAGTWRCRSVLWRSDCW